MLARLTLAERSLDLQYYIWHDDTVGKLLIGAVLRAADRGVRVRLLIDDVGASPDDRTLLLLDFVDKRNGPVASVPGQAG